MVYGIEELLDIHIHDDIYSPCHYHFSQNIQRLMAISVRPEAVRYIQEVGFKDCLKDFLYTHLDDFVLNGWNSKRPHIPVTLGNIGSSPRLWAVFPQLHPIDKPLDIGVFVDFILL